MLTGKKLGRYKIGRMIGSGGMGEVYIARDEQLDRDVALKVLLAEFCSQAERVNRFKFEAKAVSALNHPNIITIHEIAEIDEKLFIATEFIDGKTLRERIDTKDLDTYEIVKIAEQVADALAIAHEENIVHRDIKPENIMIRKDGYSKILDFGLAKPIFQGVSDKEDATLQLIKTQPGLVMGSVRYMSPEQARGKETDGRTDVWSLGVTLYEMLTGENPFDGETISDSLAAVIHKEPKSLKDVPQDLSWMIEKALNKNPSERYQHIRDFALDLKDMRLRLDRESLGHESLHISRSAGLAKQDTSENKTLVHQTISTDNATDEKLAKTQYSLETVAGKEGVSKKWIFAGVAVVALLAISSFYFLPKLLITSDAQFQSVNVSRLTDTGNASRAAVSPDGKMVAFIENRENQGKLLLRQIETGGTVEIVPYTDKGFFAPTFTPDGNFIYYSTYINGVGTLYKIPTLGGKSVELINDIDSPVAFSPDGEKFAFLRHNAKVGGSEVIIADKNGENSKSFLNTKDVEYEKFGDVDWSADGTTFLVMGFAKSDTEYRKIKVITVDVETQKVEEPFWIQDLNKDKWWTANNFVWLKNDSGVVFIGNSESNDTRQVFHINFADGKMTRVTNDISNYESLSTSDDAKVLVANKVDMNTKLVSYSPKSNETKEVLPSDKKYSFWSGFTENKYGEVVYAKHSDDGMFLYSMDEDGKEQNFISNSKYNMNPEFTNDGNYILYRASERGQSVLWRADSDGSNPQPLTKRELGFIAHVKVSPDSKYAYFTREKREGGKLDIMRVPIDGGEAKNVFPDNQKSIKDLKFSPDGNMLAYRTQNFDSEAQKFDAKVIILKYDDGVIGEKVKEYDMNIESTYQWTSDGKNITFLKKEGSHNLWDLNVESGKLTQLTNLKSEIIPHFIWSKKGDKAYIVEGEVNNDLILLKSDTAK